MSHLSEESYYSESEEEADDSGSEGEEAEWTADHLKLLYLISQYAKVAMSADENEGWIRKNQLIVLMYLLLPILVLLSITLQTSYHHWYWSAQVRVHRRGGAGLRLCPVLDDHRHKTRLDERHPGG